MDFLRVSILARESRMFLKNFTIFFEKCNKLNSLEWEINQTVNLTYLILFSKY
jgi:hypothetical protein